MQTVDSLLRKGGYRGSITQEIRCSVSLTRFQSDSVSVSYSEYISFKQSTTPSNSYATNGLLGSHLNHMSGGLTGSALISCSSTVASLIHQNGILNGFHHLMSSRDHQQNNQTSSSSTSSSSLSSSLAYRDSSALLPPASMTNNRGNHNMSMSMSPTIPASHIHHRYPTREHERHHFPPGANNTNCNNTTVVNGRYLPHSPNHPYCPPHN